MAAESILDRLDKEHGGARQYVATLIVVGKATREQVCEAMARKYSIPAPTPRSVTTWQNGDEKLVAMIRELENIRREVSPDDDLAAVLAKLPKAPDPAEAVADLLGVAIRLPAFARLLVRNAATARHTDGEGFYGTYSGAVDDADAADDVAEVLAAEHETDAEFEADCKRRLAADPVPAPLDP